MVNKGILAQVKKRLVTKFRPERIILFGSQARKTADPRSDVDLLVISPFKGKRSRKTLEMDRALRDLDFAFDIVLMTAEEYEEDRRIPGTLGRYASKEGKVLYERN
jgi:uncharacterized protein